MFGKQIIRYAATAVMLSGAVALAGTTVSHLEFKGDMAIATFDEVSASDPCLENFVFIFAADQMQKISPGPKSTTVKASLSVSQVDICTGILLFSGEGRQTCKSFEWIGARRH